MDIAIVTTKGYVKVVSSEDFRTQAAGGRGLIIQKTNEVTGEVADTAPVMVGTHLLITTSMGMCIRIPRPRTIGRNTIGIRAIHLNADDYVVSVLSL